MNKSNSQRMSLLNMEENIACYISTIDTIASEQFTLSRGLC